MAYIVLKFDDLNIETAPSFQAVHEYCKQLRVPVCFGVIGESLYDPPESYVSLLKKMMDENVELWNHGYYHTESEFSSCFTQQQKESVQLTQDYMKRYIGRKPVTFGSPHNNSTEKTIGVLSNNFPEIKNYLFMADSSGISPARQLLMRCNYEAKPGVVDLDFFRKEYERIKEYPYYVMQGHPSFWCDEDFEGFKEILNILINDGNVIVTAEELGQKNISGYMNDSLDAWIESLESFYIRHDKIFYYGAGEIGREVYRFMSLRGFKPYGFVVSNGRRDVPDVCGVPVFELSEIMSKPCECGIVPTILGSTHKEILNSTALSSFDIWMPGNAEDIEEYNRFIDYVRYDVSLRSWQL